MKQWYEQLFENYANSYEKEGFTQGTINECNFIESEIAYNKEILILDVGCGTGRHSIELAKRGYKIKGIDLSESMLQKAKIKAEAANLSICFEQHDARKLPFNNEFDLVIMLCEGGFPLMETDEMNYEILKSAARALKSKGKFIFTTLNGLFPIHNSIEKFCATNSVNDNASYRNNRFDLITFRDYNTTEITDDSGNVIHLECNERYYIPSEISWLLKSLQFEKIDFFGAHLGDFSRAHVLTTDDFEMLVIAEKK